MKKTMQHIIISRTDNIGDVILTLPLAVAIKKSWPHCKISVLARTYVKDVVEAHPDVDHFIDWTELKKQTPSNSCNQLTALQADVILHVFPVKSIAKLAKHANIPLRIGTNRRWYHWLYCNRLVNFSRKKSSLHEAQLNMILLKGLNLPNQYDLNQLKSMVTLQPKPASPDLTHSIDPNRFTLIVHPLSHGHSKDWPVESFTRLCQQLNPDRYQVLVTGSAKEGERLQSSSLLAVPHVKSLCGQLSLGELLTLTSLADGVIANSTGPLHMAAACGTQTLGLFPKKPGINPSRWGPIGPHAMTLTPQALCITCRIAEHCICMQRIRVDDVLKTIQHWQ